MMTTRGTMELSDVRRHHLSLVLDHLARTGPRSRARLSAETGLTMSALVGELLDRGLVEEIEDAGPRRVGRPGTAVAVTGANVGGLGLQIDVDHLDACVVDLAGDVRVHHRADGDIRARRSGRVLQRLRTLAERAIADAAALGIRCFGATLALPGLVDPASGALFVAPNLHWLGEHGMHPTAALRLPPGLPIGTDNEANLGALAEQRFGAGRHLSSFVYVSGGIGIGAGVMLDGRLARGAHGFAGEIGHVVVDPTGPRCACGNRGCLETSDRSPVALAAALRSVVHVLDPEAIVLGGTFAALGDAFAADVAAALHASTLGARWHPCEVLRSELGADAALIGAATAALDLVLTDPTVVPLRDATPA
jgi:predicted NBD/HSP70 family sugar kinase